MFSVRNATVAALLLLLPAGASAHPVPKDSHDRFITVRLQDGSKPGTVLLKIDYRLEMDEFTAWQDREMRDFLRSRKIDASEFARKANEFYANYGRVYGEIIGRNLCVQVNGRLVPLQVGKQSQTLTDEGTGKPLGHVRCDFEFSAEFPVKADVENVLEVREANFADDPTAGKNQFKLVNESKTSTTQQTVPDVNLYELPRTDRPLDFDDRMQRMSMHFVPANENAVNPSPAEDHEHPPASRDHDGHDDAFLRLYRWLRETDAGLWLILLAFAGLGAAHALTPGHGKTLVAAYLVGQHGTVWHAVLLGLVTTITHTAAVLIIAAVLSFVPLNESAKQAIQSGLGLVLGISVACLGLWLLLQRLSGRADHVHIGGGHDHHHHHQHGVSAKPDRPLGWWGIVLLGMSGGLIPCWDAVAILAMVVGSNEFWFALPALLAFSAGLAAVLVVIGVLVVQVRDFAGSKWGEGGLVRALPLISAVVVTAMGIYLCYASLPRSTQ